MSDIDSEPYPLWTSCSESESEDDVNQQDLRPTSEDLRAFFSKRTRLAQTKPTYQPKEKQPRRETQVSVNGRRKSAPSKSSSTCPKPGNSSTSKENRVPRRSTNEPSTVEAASIQDSENRGSTYEESTDPQHVTPQNQRGRKQHDPPSECSTPVSNGVEMRSKLEEITSLLNVVVKRVERVETELQKQRTPTSSSSSSESTPSRPKLHVPLVVRVSNS